MQGLKLSEGEMLGKVIQRLVNCALGCLLKIVVGDDGVGLDSYLGGR